MNARFPGKCSCGETFPAGAEIRYRKGEGVTGCPACAGGSGASNGSASSPRSDAVIQGRLTCVKWTNGESFSIAVVSTPSRGEVTVVGALRGARIGDQVRCVGAWDRHPKFGEQIKLISIEVERPTDATGAARYLERLPGIGPERAKAIIAKLGADGAFRALDSGDVAAFAAVSGITSEMARAIVDAGRAEKSRRAAFVFLKGTCELTDRASEAVICALEESAGKGCDVAAIISADPYALIDLVRGFGWAKADRVAKAVGIAGDHPMRVRAGWEQVCRQAEDLGHTSIARATAIHGGEGTRQPGAVELLGLDREAVLAGLELAVAEGRIECGGSEDDWTVSVEDEPWIQRSTYADAERLIARRLRAMRAGRRHDTTVSVGAEHDDIEAWVRESESFGFTPGDR